jgi:putative methionine-R-sulfoxide reductase with GAF domain
VLDRFAKAAREMRHREDEPTALPVEARMQATEVLLQVYDDLARRGRDASLEEACEAVSRHVRRLAPAGLVVFYLREERLEQLHAAYASGFGEHMAAGLTLPMGHGISGWVAANQQSVLNAAPALDFEDRFDALRPSFQSVMSVPLVSDRAAVGALSLYSIQANAFTDAQRHALELVASAIVDSLATAAARRAVAEMAASTAAAGSDPLEGLLRHDAVTRAFGGRPLGLLSLRSLSGADAMAHAAVAVNQATRVADLIVRVRADELVVLMPDCDPSAGQIVAARLAEALDALPEGARVRDTLRLGFACGPYDGASVRELLDVSRRRMDGAEVATLAGALQMPHGRKGGES